MKKRKSSKNAWIFGVLGIIIVGVGSWALYSLINQGANDLLRAVGIQNFYIQGLIVIAIVFAGLILSGKNLKKAIKTLVKG